MFTGNGITLFQLVLIKNGLQLEIKCPGLRMSRHITALQAAKRTTGLRTNKRDVQLARIIAMIAECEATLKPGDITP